MADRRNYTINCGGGIGTLIERPKMTICADPRTSTDEMMMMLQSKRSIKRFKDLLGKASRVIDDF